MGSGGPGSKGEGDRIRPHPCHKPAKVQIGVPGQRSAPHKQIRRTASSRQPQRGEQAEIDQCNAWVRPTEPDFSEKPFWTYPQTGNLLLFVSAYIICSFAEENLNLGTMIAMLSFACLTCGVGLAGMSTRDAGRAPTLEWWSGVCLLAGLGLLGVALPLFR